MKEDKKVVYMITRNKGKLLAAESTLSEFGIRVLQLDKDYPEIQADTSAEISKCTALQAAKEMGLSVIREDHSLVINALNIPGPYTSYVEKRLPVERLLELLRNEKDRSGYFELAATYAEPDGFSKTFTFQVNIRISEEPGGNLSGGWNRIIILDGETRTLAEYDEKDRVGVWNKNFKNIGAFLKSRGDI